MEEKKTRSSFTGGIGFILAAAGSAVGLGNLWRFPYLAAKYGGGLFILVYIILALTFGFALMTTEIAIGRKTGLSSIGAYKQISKKFSFLGYIGALVPIIILPYYSVIGGWVMKYATVYLTGAKGVAADGGAFFGNFIGGTSALPWFAIFLAITSIIILCGVQKGIENVSKVMMPILLVLTIGLAIYIITLPNAMAGVKYYFIPNFEGMTLSKFVTTLLAAMGQLFFSMSLAMGIMITYGSYVKKEVNLSSSVNQIEIWDTAIALLAGLMVIPAVAFANGGSLEGMNGGAGLMFVSLPSVFNSMPFGNVIGALFFILVLLAALTSSISIMEAVVSIFMEKFKITRNFACVVAIIISVILGVPSSLGNGLLANVKIIGMDFLTFFDFVSNSVLMPVVAFFTCILIGWVAGTKYVTDEVSINGEKFARKGIYKVMIKYICPIFLIAILIFYVLQGFGVIAV